MLNSTTLFYYILSKALSIGMGFQTNSTIIQFKCGLPLYVRLAKSRFLFFHCSNTNSGNLCSAQVHSSFGTFGKWLHAKMEIFDMRSFFPIHLELRCLELITISHGDVWDNSRLIETLGSFQFTHVEFCGSGGLQAIEISHNKFHTDTAIGLYEFCCASQVVPNL